jgi:hypothetical protein
MAKAAVNYACNTSATDSLSAFTFGLAVCGWRVVFCHRDACRSFEVTL